MSDAAVERAIADGTAVPLDQRQSGFLERTTALLWRRQPSDESHGTLVSDDEKLQSSKNEDETRDAEVTRLALNLRRHSTWSSVPGNPFEAEPGSDLDPTSKSFNPRKWLKSTIKLNDAEGTNPRRSAGVAFRNLNVHGYGASTDYQKDVANTTLELVGLFRRLFGLARPRRIDILRDFEGLVRSGEMLVVLGPPGSGCTTFLKTLTGQTHGFIVDDGSNLNYQGVSPSHMHSRYRGEAIYTAEVDVHFPMLSVGDTLDFAARARAPKHIPGGLDLSTWSTHMRDVVMAMFGISHTVNTQVGNDFVRGVSGGERKRVTIAEAFLSGAPLQAWDNSTRGLDSANAVEFCKTLRTSSELGGTAAMVAIYQAPQAAYDLFDKVLVLYKGRQIYFGRTTEARAYFTEMGFDCPERQTDADFLTSMTSPQERIVRKGFEDRVPRTPDDFAKRWTDSEQRAQLLKDIAAFEEEYPIDGDAAKDFAHSRRAQQAKLARRKSPYTLSYPQQVSLCLRRGFQRLRGDPSLTYIQLGSNVIISLVLGSVFYNLSPTTDSFFTRSALLFFALLMNAFGSILEILLLYAQRPIVEKQSRYAMYHPSAEAFASMLTDMPYKFTNAITSNIPLYFLANLRREPGAFFFFLLVSFEITLVMSMIFRTTASVSRTLAQAMAPSTILILAIVAFTGFAIPVTYMLSWCRWINYIDPVAYGFEALVINEFSGRDFECSTLVPSYGDVALQQSVCNTAGAVAGRTTVSGETYINLQYAYFSVHKWRNVGVVIAFTVLFMLCYLAAAEYISAKKSKGEVLLFRRGHKPASLQERASDEETANAGAAVEKENHTEASDVIQKQTAIFSWRNVCYDIKIKSEERRILDHVDGYVKPGTLTALMGVSGAGKTTLLDVLATRVTIGVISGEMLVDGRQRDSSFQRKTGYVQQQDLHLETSTVREALKFSALLRQPAKTSRKDKIAYVDEVIKLLDMQEYADAVVGVPGEGLNVEQRKRLTIGVELAAKPELLLFLDEPTSGLDSQTSWAICDLMEKLTRSGQAVLCTIHQPSAMLFQRFSKLLFLAQGGKTVYFGNIGQDSKTLIEYFERNGGPKCPKDANPAEWMLEVIGAAPGAHSDTDWFQTWRDSDEYKALQHELDELKTERPKQTKPRTDKNDKLSYKEFAAPYTTQLWEVTYRVFQQYWRTPSYIYSKTALCTLAALFVGFIFFKSPLTRQGLQNQMLSIFLLLTLFGQLVDQIMPNFVTQRSLYEARERPSKTYSWKVFMASNIIVELPWNALMGTIVFFCFYYPVGFYQNAIPTGAVAERGALFFLFCVQFLLYTSSFANLVIAGMPDADTAGAISTLLFILFLLFCGVLAPPETLPRFWIFLYRLSPFTYLIEGMLGAGLANQQVRCSEVELLTFQAPSGTTCQTYMQPYISNAGGYLLDPTSTTSCNYCAIADTNTFLTQVSTSYGNRWRNFGILWAYIIFNTLGAVFLYWLVRVPKGAKKKSQEKKSEDKA